MGMITTHLPKGHFREHQRRLTGSAGPASPVRLLDRKGRFIGIEEVTADATGRVRQLKAYVPKVRRSDWQAARRQRETRLRNDLGRKRVKAEPKHGLLCEALRRFAAASEPGTDKVAKLIRAVRDDVPGWEDDDELLKAVGTAIIDEWSRRWARE